jgi:MFS transporter, DHA2 family, multidrug resistance protein
VARHEQLHRNELTASLKPGRVSVSGALNGIQQFVGEQGSSPTTAMRRAYGLVNLALNEQARLWSYVDDFRYMALACFACIPIVFTLKKAMRKGGATSGAH